MTASAPAPRWTIRIPSTYASAYAWKRLGSAPLTVAAKLGVPSAISRSCRGWAACGDVDPGR